MSGRALPADLAVRPARRDELAAIRELVFGIAREHGFEPEPGGCDADVMSDAEYFAPGAMLAVLVDGSDTVRGMVGVTPRGEGTAELRKLYLAGDLRGRGLGERLLSEAIDFARASGCRRLLLETSSRLASAAALYERRGFRAVAGDTRSCACDRLLELTWDA